MTEKFLISSAKTVKDLDAAYAKAKTAFKDYGFDKSTELKIDVVKKAMTEAKKPADFIAEYDVGGKALIGQLVCDVKGKMRSVIGRSQITSKKELKQYKGIASNQALDKNIDQFIL